MCEEEAVDVNLTAPCLGEAFDLIGDYGEKLKRPNTVERPDSPSSTIPSIEEPKRRWLEEAAV